jgi:hypothetical protein
MDEDALKLDAIVGGLGDHVNAVNLAEAHVANDESDALLGNVGKNARNT